VTDISYLLSPSGTILEVLTPEAWTAFALANGGDGIADPRAAEGHPIARFISGEETRLSVETALRVAAAGTPLRYLFRCDAPTVRRSMRMRLERTESGDVRAITHLLAEEPRAARLLFADPLAAPAGWPLRRICSYCKRIEDPGRPGEWLDGEEYESRGHTLEARLSHGVCPDCGAHLEGSFEGEE